MHRGVFVWEVIRNQHRPRVILEFKRLADWSDFPADQLSSNIAGNYTGK